jgi:hypothetical protein
LHLSDLLPFLAAFRIAAMIGECDMCAIAEVVESKRVELVIEVTPNGVRSPLATSLREDGKAGFSDRKRFWIVKT